MSGKFDRSDPQVNRILQNHPDVDQVQFITNAINTRTRGIDMVMNGNWKIHKANLGFMLAANFNRTNIFGPIQVADSLDANTINTNILFNVEEKEKIEHGQPGSKIILSTIFIKANLDLYFATHVSEIPLRLLYSLTQATHFMNLFRPKFLRISASIILQESWLTITVGANNVFNVYPDRLKNYRNTNEGIFNIQ